MPFKQKFEGGAEEAKRVCVRRVLQAGGATIAPSMLDGVRGPQRPGMATREQEMAAVNVITPWQGSFTVGLDLKVGKDITVPVAPLTHP